MATFYLLPPRACLEQAAGELLGKLLPGLPLPADLWDVLTQQLAASACWRADVFLVPRDEIPEGDHSEALVGCYGAEPGDRVVEVSLARPPRTWVIGSTGVPTPAAAR